MSINARSGSHNQTNPPKKKKKKIKWTTSQSIGAGGDPLQLPTVCDCIHNLPWLTQHTFIHFHTHSTKLIEINEIISHYYNNNIDRNNNYSTTTTRTLLQVCVRVVFAAQPVVYVTRHENATNQQPPRYWNHRSRPLANFTRKKKKPLKKKGRCNSSWIFHRIHTKTDMRMSYSLRQRITAQTPQKWHIDHFLFYLPPQRPINLSHLRVFTFGTGYDTNPSLPHFFSMKKNVTLQNMKKEKTKQ